MESHLLFENIDIFDVAEIDCFQNLLFSYLNFYKADINLLKINWPWRFKRKNNKASSGLITFESCDAANLKKINDYYNNCGEQIYFLDTENKLEIINKCLKKYGAVFVCVDEYYVPYHFNHIFEKQHGLHTLLITGIDMANKTVECISAIPKFKGTISLDYFEKAVYSKYVKEWYVFFKSNIFANYASISYNDILRNEITFNDVTSDIVYTGDVLDYLKRSNGNIELLEYMCQGTWGWKITAKGKILIDFFQNTKEYDKETECICEYIDKINSLWDKGYKLVFKYICSKQMTLFNRALEYIEEANKNEKQLAIHLNNIIF